MALKNGIKKWSEHDNLFFKKIAYDFKDFKP